VTIGLRIYNLFPTLAGPIKGASKRDWYSHLDRIAAMEFDWLFVNPFHAPGLSGSLYAIKDPYALHPVVHGTSDKATDDLLSDFIAAAKRKALSFMMDLVINHTSKDAPLAEAHPEWYRRNPDGTLYSPRAIDPGDTRKVTVWGDLAQLDYDNPEARGKLVAYWSNYIRHYLRLGVRGFRCDAAYQVPAEVWDELITAARNEVSDVLFVAETLGSTVEQVNALQTAGFDYLFNSSKWWDFKAPWLLNQYEEFRRIAPSIAFPESHDTDRLVNELDNQDREQIVRHYRFSYLFTAAFSSGIMIPMGFEYGFSKPLHVVHTTPQDWFTQLETSPFDITAFIAQANAMKAACPTLNCEGPQRIVSDSAQEVVALYRLTGEADKNDCSLTLVNPSPQNTARVDVNALLSKVQQTSDVFTEVTPEQVPEKFEAGEDLLLEPLAVRVFRGDYASIKPVVLNEMGFSDVTIRRSSRTADTKKALPAK
jgi:starch synthase (maltosyl-transferring)